MCYYNIPNICDNVLDKFLLKYESLNENKPFINNSIQHYLSTVKHRINDYIDIWDIAKKFTNSYEFIHTNVPETKDPICQYKPLSRSFFKMIEMINDFDIFENLETPINSFHLAEGPGGFIEALVYSRNNKLDNYYGMTLIDNNDKNIPGWKKSEKFINENKNVHIEKGISEDGNLYDSSNFIYCAQRYGNTMDFITADGGFDFSIDFNKQEAYAIRLILSQIFFAISMQKHN